MRDLVDRRQRIFQQKAENSVQKYLQTAARATDLEMFVWLGIAPADQVERVQTNIFCYFATGCVLRLI